MIDQIIGEECVCPECGAMFNSNVNIGDGFLHDVCGGCGFKRKKTMDGEIVESIILAENIRQAEKRRKDRSRS